VQLLCRYRVLRFNNEPAALDGNEVGVRGEVGGHFTKEIAEGAHGAGKSQLLFEAEGACRFRE
jgi:hypothetical protein